MCFSISLSLFFSFFPRSPFPSLVLWALPLLRLQECKKHIWNLLERRKGENGLGDGKREQGKMRRLTKEWKAKWGPEQGAFPQNHFWKVGDEQCTVGAQTKIKQHWYQRLTLTKHIVDEWKTIHLKGNMACSKSFQGAGMWETLIGGGGGSKILV